MLASRTCINLIILVIMVTDVIGVSYDEWSSFDENDNGIIQSSNNFRVELNDWDSNLYGKPICLKIPSNLTLCNDINYKEMKVPNLLGHETLDEIEDQSAAWLPLVKIGCHPDTQLFLCSLFAPICLEQPIYPCRSLCESVRNKCEAKMLEHSYSWPKMFDCSKFPADNSLCIKRELETTETSTVPTTTTTTKPTRTKIKSTQSHKASTKANRPNKHMESTQLTDNRGAKQCVGCSTVDNMDVIIEEMCQADMVVKAGIETFDESIIRPLEKQISRKAVSGSKYISLSRKARKFLKGRDIMLGSQNYLTGDGKLRSHNRQLDVFLLSKYYFEHAQIDRKLTRRRHATYQQGNQFCRCRKIRKNLYNENTKFLIMARILPAKNFYYNRNAETSTDDKVKVINNKTKLLYLTHVVPWQKAKQLVRFIDHDFNMTMLCNNRTITFS